MRTSSARDGILTALVISHVPRRPGAGSRSLHRTGEEGRGRGSGLRNDEYLLNELSAAAGSESGDCEKSSLLRYGTRDKSNRILVSFLPPFSRGSTGIIAMGWTASPPPLPPSSRVYTVSDNSLRCGNNCNLRENQSSRSRSFRSAGRRRGGGRGGCPSLFISLHSYYPDLMNLSALINASRFESANISLSFISESCRVSLSAPRSTRDAS